MISFWRNLQPTVLIANYLSNRYHHLKIGSTFSSYLEILRGVPQGSILGPILFNLFINDLMFFIQETEVCNFADDTTIYSCSSYFEDATLKLSNNTHLILNWFRINSMVANPGNIQIMFLGANIDNSKITLTAWWQTPANFRLCFLAQTLIIAKLH